MVEKKNNRGKWKDVPGTVVNKTNEDFEGETKQMMVGMKRILGKQAGEADTGMPTLRAEDGKWLVVRREKGKYQSSISVS